MSIHTFLDPDRREIRLARLIHHSLNSIKQHRSINLELKVISLEDCVPYSALSYVWESAADPAEIYINGRSFRVTQNLYSALTQLTSNGVDSWLWIDAICIAQSNVDEKNHQIKLMRDIYGGAEMVYLWLGASTEESDQAMDFIAKRGPRLYSCGASTMRFDSEKRAVNHYYITERLSPEGGQVREGPGSELSIALFDVYTEYLANRVLPLGFRDILLRPYWSRVWIIQEVVLAKQAVVVAGSRMVPLEIFDAMVTGMWESGNAMITKLSMTMYRIKALQIRETRRQRGDVVRLGKVLWESGAAPGRPHYAATDPRDIVIGLLGVLGSEERQGLSVDYNMSFVDIFTQATRMMMSSDDFDLDSVIPGDLMGPLPTWVPDFREIGRDGVWPYSVNHLHRFSATGTRLQPTEDGGEMLGNGPVLRRWGCIVDEITEIMEPPEDFKKNNRRLPINSMETWRRRIIDFVGLGMTPSSSEDYVWRTATNGYHHLGRSIYGRDISDGVPHFIRLIMRGEAIDMSSLTVAARNFLHCWIFPDNKELDNETAANHAGRFLRDVAAGAKGRTLFKTLKGMLGLGHVDVQVGDVVTLIWGVNSPIILRQREQLGFYFKGDAYVDGIMNGEFLGTEPKEVEFAIY
ncbi:heterokaryon incompatibility protein [Colletotrichum truncatum]|uniref:Heterokaryon incompatibility protein n=1 Tax=Colletotrichum truncatum TaxID=5467 RepID=A0ACC3YF72_COLTU|nr:heterokaryon incompatibility protein [Colletotrichum truncatum]KAF6788236.1 heterokaryon incompatibility protein [Colletotrichum truncatum]